MNLLIIHRCHNSKIPCILKSFFCNGASECDDSSDEIGCISATVTVHPPFALAVRVGQSINISCSATGKPSPLILWTLNNSHVPIGPRVSQSSTGEGRVRGNLVIKNAVLTNAGVYSCQGANNQRYVSGQPNITVTVTRAEGKCAGYEHQISSFLGKKRMFGAHGYWLMAVGCTCMIGKTVM